MLPFLSLFTPNLVQFWKNSPRKFFICITIRFQNLSTVKIQILSEFRKINFIWSFVDQIFAHTDRKSLGKNLIEVAVLVQINPLVYGMPSAWAILKTLNWKKTDGVVSERIISLFVIAGRVCHPSQRLLKSSKPWDAYTGFEQTLNNECEHQNLPVSFFVGEANQPGYMIWDIGCPVQLEQIHLKNTHNRGWQK